MRDISRSGLEGEADCRAVAQGPRSSALLARLLQHGSLEQQPPFGNLSQEIEFQIAT